MTTDNVDRTYVVLGGSSGIGAALCRRLARGKGNRIFVHGGARREKLAAVAAEIRDRGAEAIEILGAIDSPDAAAEVMEKIGRETDHVDGFAHLVGYADRKPVGEATVEELNGSFQTNVRSLFDVITQALPLVRKSEKGRILCTGSWVAHRFKDDEFFRFPVTAITKAGVVAFARALAAQLAAENITVNAIVPGNIKKDPDAHTSLTDDTRSRLLSHVPMGRFGEQDEVAAAAEFLLSPSAGYITGHALFVDGGVTL